MDELLEFTIDTAQRAGSLLRKRLGSALTIEHKGAINLVTDADRESEELIVSSIERAYPGHTIVAEERPQGGKSPIYKWYIDPLDGTTNFSHGYPIFAVSIAHEVKNRLVLGVVYDPTRDELFRAVRGRGAYLNDDQITVSTVDELDKGLISTGFPYDLRTNPDKPIREFNRFLMVSQAVRRDGSAALDMCYLACGRYDGFYERNLGPWDTAAGCVIIEEAGGVITDFRGKPFRPGGKTILASNSLIHMQMMEVLEQSRK